MCVSTTVTHCSTVTVHCFSLQRGVCDRAFAPNTSQENNECHQNCLSGTLCEEMCDATSSLPSSRGNHNAEANKWHNPHCAIWAGAVVLCVNNVHAFGVVKWLTKLEVAWSFSANVWLLNVHSSDVRTFLTIHISSWLICYATFTVKWYISTLLCV